MDSSLGPVQEGMERPTGFEPVPGPWQGPVLPLYYGRPIQQNINMATLWRQGPCNVQFDGARRIHHQHHARRVRNLFTAVKQWSQPTCNTRAVFTTGDFRCRSANLAAFSRSVYTRANRSPSL